MKILFNILKVISWIWITFILLIETLYITANESIVSIITVAVIFLPIPVSFLIWRFKADKAIRIQKQKIKLEKKQEEQRIKAEIKEIEEKEKLEKQEERIEKKEEKKLEEYRKNNEVKIVDNKKIYRLTAKTILCPDLVTELEINENWVTIKRSDGYSNWAVYGKGEKKIHIKDISGVQFKKPGKIFKTIDCGQLDLITKTNDTNSHMENTILFHIKHNDLAKSFAEDIERKIDEYNNSCKVPPQIIQQQTQTVAQQLKDFKELLDCGIITQEEFDKKKAELL